MSTRPFYENGLKFECQNCRYCCSVEPGFVFLSEEEIQNMASYLSLRTDEFIDTYCRRIGDNGFFRISLKEKENYDCIFLRKNGCAIYDVRPHQCRTYPFWKRICQSREAWEEEAKFCPGINKGTLHSKEEIEEKLSK